MGFFGVMDYVVFVATLVISLLIGVFFGFIKKQKTSDDLLVGGRKMNLFAVSMSLLATYMSAILILGLAGEIYANGTLITEAIIGAIIYIPLSGLLFLPTLYKLKLTSAYEYLELRFKSSWIRKLTTATFMVQITLYTGIVLYAPAIALESILDIPVWITVVLMGGCAGLYTSIGGIQAVVWTDAFQIFMMFAGMLAIIIKGTINVGGISNVFDIASKNQRVEYLNFTVDPFLRHSTLNIFFGNGIGWLYAYGCNQATVQRYCSLSTFRRALTSVVITGPLVAFTMCLGAMSGIVLAANYAGCDPLTLGFIKKKDQIAPYFVSEHLSPTAGLVGLFVAALFSGSLSTVSSVLNSLSAVVWEDFLKTIPVFANYSGTAQGWIVKLIALIFMAITVGLGLVVGKLGGILTATLAINGSVAGPLLGVFVLGIFFPFCNKYGAVAGLISGLAGTFYVSLGAILTGNNIPASLPYRIDECSADQLSKVTNLTAVFIKMNSTSIPHPPVEWPEKIYTLSYMLYPLIGVSITVITACIVSLITGPTELTKDNEKYIHPVLIWLRKQLKQSSRNGVVAHGDENGYELPVQKYHKKSSIPNYYSNNGHRNQAYEQDYSINNNGNIYGAKNGSRP